MAGTVTVGSVDYDVTFFVGTYNSNTSLFQVPPAGQSPWWGDVSGNLASEFATVVFNQLGEGPVGGYGPVFAYDGNSTAVQGIVQSLSNSSSQLDQSFASDSLIKYALATPLPQPPVSTVPGPLPLFGVVGAYAYSRRMRRLSRN
jgi:hypothetical protein